MGETAALKTFQFRFFSQFSRFPNNTVDSRFSSARTAGGTFSGRRRQSRTRRSAMALSSRHERAGGGASVERDILAHPLTLSE